MNFEVVLTCAVTGAGDTTGKSKHVPVTPEEIANSAIEAARAGASAVHLHVRDPKTGKGSRDPALFKETVDRVRASGVDVVINLTAGMGGDWTPAKDNWAMPGPGTDMIGPDERLAHIKECLPEICSLDCGTLNFGNDDTIYISTPPILRRMAALMDATEVVGVERLTGDEEHDPLLVAVLPAGAPIDVQVHPREPRPAGDPALRAALVRVAAADVGDRGGPIVAADLVIDQVIDVNVVGDARPDRLIAVNAPLPEGDGPGYRWSALVLAPSGDLAAARSVWTSDLESIFLDASFDLDGDGVRELIYSSDYYEGGGRGGATIEDGALHPLGTWACGA